MIEVDGLVVRYGKRVAVDGLSLRVAAGDVVGLLGPNGAGKSTTLLAVAGALPISSGTIHVDGIDVGREPTRALARLGLADQPPTLYDYLSVAEQLGFVAEARGVADPAARKTEVDQLIGRLGLGETAQRLCRELSFGMRQRVSLATALVGGVRTLLIDESLNGLDPHASRAARDTLVEAARAGAAIVMSTHLLGVAERVCTRLIIMEAGRIVREVAGQELAELRQQGDGALEDLYLGLVGAGP